MYNKILNVWCELYTFDLHQIYSKERTSTFIFLQKYMDQISRTIERRAADIVSVSVENVEPLQLVRYTEGQQFTLHHDGGTLVDLDSSSETSNNEDMDVDITDNEHCSQIHTQTNGDLNVNLCQSAKADCHCYVCCCYFVDNVRYKSM